MRGSLTPDITLPISRLWLYPIYFSVFVLFAGGAARHSGGSIYAYPGLHNIHNPVEVERYENDLRRYLTRKIGLEAVMRVRCTKGCNLISFIYYI